MGAVGIREIPLPRNAFDERNLADLLNGANLGNPLTSAWGALYASTVPTLHAIRNQTYLPGPFFYQGMAPSNLIPTQGDPTILSKNSYGYRGDAPTKLQPVLNLPPPWERARG